MTRQKTLFSEPEPEPDFPPPRDDDPSTWLLTLEDDEPAYGIAAYVQELYEKWRPRIGETLATRRVVRIVNGYHQIEEGEQ